LGGLLFWIGFLCVVLVFVPSFIYFLLYVLFGYYSKRYVAPVVNGVCGGRVSVVIPVLDEPLDYIDNALRNVFEWGLGNGVEVIVVSMDPYEKYLEIKSIVDRWRIRGLETYCIWRGCWRGFKSGSLNIGLWFSNGDYFYVMDVDSRVDSSFINNACNILSRDGNVVAVVGRWVGSNRDTRLAEAISSSMNVVVDTLYRGRSGLNLPVLTLGTGTLYRSSYLKWRLGGWDIDRIMDDLEIGCRIMGLDGKIAYLDNHNVYVDVPRRYRSLRIQQERWVYGALDTLITRFRYIVSSKLPWYAKFETMYYLLQYLPAVTTFIGFLLMIPIMIISPRDLFGIYWYLGLAWLILAMIYGWNYISILRKNGYTTWRALVNLGRSSALTVALTPVFTRGFFKALFRRRMVFKRTPKGSYESSGLSSLRFPVELSLGLLSLLLSIYLLSNHIFFSGGWFLTYSLGYIYVSIRWWRDVFYK